ncbi:MAG: 50S ribosomal protein L25 [Candidatus Beckwithbacteria bacterium GW2011_GWA2_43_10]|uniref:Large ribosomal subunit protein bL25 n=1 Tax=Candidatus Beckwithbacteria bacterium GW2011_GWA2_43_10 TaxID=1618369 RepID=A0A0G1C4E8_9BACT|nr:MAG: 50S ribosomal protein L25 [Candidatus Beckwithbacteria bacterium GW2011_GWA2_43_10]
MPNKLKLKVDARKLIGRKVKQLRAQGILPANIYGKRLKSISIQLPLKDFAAVFKQVGETGILELVVNKETKTRPVLVHHVQQHPVSDEILHVDFRQVDLTETVTVSIPVEISGEAPAITKGGVLIQLINQVEVEALPADLPDKFTLDVSKLEKIGQGFSLKDLKVSAKVKLLADNLEELVVKIESPTKEEEVKPVEEVPAEEETAVPAEGEEAPAPKKAEEPAELKKDQPKADQPMAGKK